MLPSVFAINKLKVLKVSFARLDKPEQLVNDSGPQFVSCNLLKFSQEWYFEHLTNSPHHSQANDNPESSVGEAKKILMKCRKAGLKTFLALLDHRNTPSMGIHIFNLKQYLSNSII